MFYVCDCGVSRSLTVPYLDSNDMLPLYLNVTPTRKSKIAVIKLAFTTQRRNTHDTLV